jgi:hypothetical protein
MLCNVVIFFSPYYMPVVLLVLETKQRIIFRYLCTVHGSWSFRRRTVKSERDGGLYLMADTIQRALWSPRNLAKGKNLARLFVRSGDANI